ncbi:hypothetical protein AKG11_03565 [Shinella sp. SUS2]|uniref:hypothetical protein n=1 Tax=unclassified Shinella TaxID=2643062 RepID=UPI000681A7C6|nr:MULTISPECIES: hypothetical protein [unclassified Shinella]KNY18531.1 hypothetical protein AKG11_03565 [Shinella sp. SUS2]KOC77700.1 hypothetical protein AKG10_01035 [Shinella sp. GWS1]
MKDLHSKISAMPIIMAALSADNTPSALDLKGYDSAEILLGVGIGGVTFTGTDKIEFKLTHADDKADGSAPDAGDFSAVALKDVLGVESVGSGGIIKALTAAHPAAAAYRVGYKGGKRWLKLLADFSGTHGSATPLGVFLLRGNGFDNPQANQA